MKGLTKDEIKISVFSKLEKELKKIGIKVAESYISTDRDYGYIKGIPEPTVGDSQTSEDEIAITVEVFSDPDNTSRKTAFNLKDRDYEIDPNKGLGLEQDFYIIATTTNKWHKFYVYSKDEMSTIIQDGVLQNIIKSQLSKTASKQSNYILSLDNFTKSENDPTGGGSQNKWSKLLKK